MHSYRLERNNPIHMPFQGNVYLFMASSCSVLLACSALLNFAYDGLTDLLFFVFPAVASVSIYDLRNHIRNLKFRIKINNPDEWNVQLNGVSIGALQDAAYAEIRLRTFTDIRIYIAQALNWAVVCLHSIKIIFYAIPFGAMWLVMLVAMYTPLSIREVFNTVQATDPLEISASVSECVRLMSVLLMLLLYLLMGLKVSWLGFSNCFSEAIANAICSHFGAQVQHGDFMLTISAPDPKFQISK